MKPLAPPAAITKIPTGIRGFDEITGGGLPRGRTTLLMGGPGCGKTVFALQALVHGARDSKEAAIFVAFEEGTEQIVANAATFGWNLPALMRRKLIFLDARLSPGVVKAGEFDLVGMLTFLGARAEQLGATRIVFDGIDVLLSLLDDPAAERREIYRIRDWLAQSGMTAIITQKAGSADADRRYGFLQFMADCVVVVRHQVVDGSAFRSLRVAKYRGSAFSGDEFPIALVRTGMELTHRGPAELRYRVTNERVSTGIQRLDHMLRGGYHRGSYILISGSPGTAKSTLGGLFTSAACARGERTLYVSFDEGAAQIVRNLRSVNVRLAPHVKSGLLRMYSTRTRGPNVDDQFAALRDLVHEHDPRCVVIDPLSALLTKVAHVASADAAQQFLDHLKARGVTVLSTSLMGGLESEQAAATGISTIADTWIHLSYVIQDGERNRALTIVKSRGTGHSNQVRELTLADDGVTLTDAFVAQGKVLMGVARWEWEQEALATRRRAQAATDRRRLRLQLERADAAARLGVLQAEIQTRDAELALLAVTTGAATKLRRSDHATRSTLRHADEDVRARPPRRPGRATPPGA